MAVGRVTVEVKPDMSKFIDSMVGFFESFAEATTQFVEKLEQLREVVDADSE